MPDDTINAEELPDHNPASLGTLLGLGADSSGVQYEAEPIIKNRWFGKTARAASFSIDATMEAMLQAISSSSAIVVTVPAGIDFPLLGRIPLVRLGTGAVSFVAGAGVTLLTAGRPKARAQGSFMELVKIDTNSWLLAGDTAA